MTCAARSATCGSRRDNYVGTIHAAEDEDSDKLWKKIKGGHVTDISTGNVPIEVVNAPPARRKSCKARSTKRANSRS